MEKQTPEKFDLRSHDLLADKQAALRAAFPEVFTEGGKIDFDRLKMALGEAVDAGKERYGMNWPGKAELFQNHSAAAQGRGERMQKQGIAANAPDDGWRRAGRLRCG